MMEPDSLTSAWQEIPENERPLVLWMMKVFAARTAEERRRWIATVQPELCRWIFRGPAPTPARPPDGGRAGKDS
jgi:hypothetical protein